MLRLFMGLGAVSAFLGVAFGAFGAHALKQRLSEKMLATFEVGVRYQMYHALALLAVAFALSKWGASPLVNTAGWSFIAGTLLFSGSLYAYTLSGNKVFAMVTPIGGVGFLVGWACLAIAVFRASA